MWGKRKVEFILKDIESVRFDIYVNLKNLNNLYVFFLFVEGFLK